MANHSQFFSSLYIYPRCVDGRAGKVFLRWQDGDWLIDKRQEDAEEENGPQFLGASLLFVRALEVIAQLDRHQAFDLTEIASKSVGLGLQVHQDDEHGKFDIDKMTDQEIINFVKNHHSGCGFVRYAWGDDGIEVIKEAKNRKWRVQILVGNHHEHGAIVNYQPDKTFDTAKAVDFDQSVFSTDIMIAREVFLALEELVDISDFAQKAEQWMIDTYKDVVIALKGVNDPSEIEDIN